MSDDSNSAPAVAETATPEPDLFEQLRGRYAKEGPLATLIPVFIDVETFMTDEISLKKMTLRQYLSKSHVTMFAMAIGDEPVQVFRFVDGKPKEDEAYLLNGLLMLATDPRYVFVAHNAAFDIRVLRFLLNIPQPCNVWCTVEGSMGAWPELPGGYSLNTIPRVLMFPDNLQKLSIDLRAGKHTDEEMEAYNVRDVEVLREIYTQQAGAIAPMEQEVALRTHRQRQFHFIVDQEKLSALIETLTKSAEYAETEATKYLVDPTIENMSEEQKAEYLTALKQNVFNRDVVDGKGKAIKGLEGTGSLRSVRSKRLLNYIHSQGATNFNTTSHKKLNPSIAATNPRLASLIKSSSDVNKMLSHKRRSIIFRGLNEVDVELGYMRAHTGRFSSPSTGKGLNLHNIPKHLIEVAKPVRQTFRLPLEYCFVRGDLANVEYRMAGYLAGCVTVEKMFDPRLGGDPMADPYVLAWLAMVAQHINKKDPVRQVSKQAVLGLTFIMSAMGYAKVLNNVIADPKSKVTIDLLEDIIKSQMWRAPSDDSVDTIMQRLGCSRTVAIASYHIHKNFNKAHPEFATLGNWLVTCAEVVARSPTLRTAQQQLLVKASSTHAPQPDRLRLFAELTPGTDKPSIRVQCGPWAPTVCWRRPSMMSVNEVGGKQRQALTVVKANGPSKIFTRQLAIENVTQAAARNQLCWGVAELDKRGQPNVLHIHDEIMIICKRDRESVLKAREDLLAVFGPQSYNPLGWAILVKPDEVTVTESMYEDEVDLQAPSEKNGMKGFDRWRKIEQNTADCLAQLP